MKKVNAETIPPSISKLLSLATSQHKVELEYEKYVTSLNCTLYSFDIAGEMVGCIGIEQISLLRFCDNESGREISRCRTISM